MPSTEEKRQKINETQDVILRDKSVISDKSIFTKQSKYQNLSRDFIMTLHKEISTIKNKKQILKHKYVSKGTTFTKTSRQNLDMNIINATRKIRHVIKKTPKARKILLNNSLYTKLSNRFTFKSNV